MSKDEGASTESLERDVEFVLWELFDQPVHRKKKLDQIMHLISQWGYEQRINEVHNFGNWNADKGIAELWPVIETRLAELKSLQQEQSKEIE